MFRIFGMIGLFLVISISGNAEEVSKEQKKEVKDIYLLIGQSNMAGRAKYDPILDKFKKNEVFILNDKGEFQSLTPYPFINHYSTIRKSAAQISPGVMFAKVIRAVYPDKKVYLISNARGGSSITEWEKGTKYYNEAVRRTKQALKYGQLKAVLWHQGETDYRAALRHHGEESKYIEQYFAKLRRFITDLRNDLGLKDLPFIVGQLQPKYKLFNERILKMPDKIKNVAVVTSEGLVTHDGFHFDHKSVYILGGRYAEKVLKIQGKKMPVMKSQK